ncbi:M56 family metallopeptidase [Ruminococcus albus]|uniref:Peptidase, M56 family n=1 Tax=Ruminococcus albus 8 TaxID=246199 RepID=E9SFD0_RUMAL|nr:M56 family metallopeptidase [Ruminococcus albus]EGC02014.1 peptidase, M56 family [Ruminococcus albus 8]MCC3351613.1 hypothetical protein [Ruminococcus albus 8]
MEKYILSLLFCSIEMSAVSLVYIGLLKVLKNRQLPVLRYYSWLVILVGFLLPIKPNFGKAAVTINEPNAAYTYREQSINAAVPTSPSINIFQILFIVWLAVAILYLITSLCRYRIFRRGVSRLSRKADQRTLDLAADMARELCITPPVKVMILKEITTPMMTGLLAPTILLPDRRFDDTELRLILKHELTHFKHKDLWVKLLVMVCRAVYWFDPIFILISRSIEQECEHYCDHSVITGENAEQKKLYCQSILNTVSAQNSFRKTTLRPVMATNFYTPKQGLKHRLSLILSSKRKKRFALVGFVVAVLTALSGSVIAFASNTEIPPENDTSKITTTTTNAVETVAVTNTPEKSEISENTQKAKTTTMTVTSKVDTAPIDLEEDPIVTAAPPNYDTVTNDTSTAPYYDNEPIVTTAPAEWDYGGDVTTVTYTGELW